MAQPAGAMDPADAGASPADTDTDTPTSGGAGASDAGAADAQATTEDRTDPEDGTAGTAAPSGDEAPPGDAAASAAPTTPPPEEMSDPAARSPEPVPEAPMPCSARAREVALDSVVRVRSGHDWGAGFVYGTRRNVVTAFRLIRLGRGIRVVTRDGRQHDARVLARDESADLAILALDEDLDAPPLQPAPESSAAVGHEVVAMGHPFPGVSQALGERGIGLLRWSVSQGRVAAVNDTAVQADIALSAGHAGGPLLDCEGRAVGMITGAGILSPNVGLMVRTARIDRVMGDAGEPSDFLGTLRPQLGIGGALHIDQSGRVALGVYLTLGAVLFDRISWMNRIGLFMGGVDGPTGDELSVDRQLIRIESLLGYRFFVDVFGLTTLYVVPAGGLAVENDRLSTRRAAVTPMCTPDMDTSCVDISETTSADWLVRPAAGLSFLFGGTLEISYAIEIALDVDPVVTYHQVRLGVLF